MMPEYIQIRISDDVRWFVHVDDIVAVNSTVTELVTSIITDEHPIFTYEQSKAHTDR
jgi:hypothetical protein